MESWRPIASVTGTPARLAIPGACAPPLMGFLFTATSSQRFNLLRNAVKSTTPLFVHTLVLCRAKPGYEPREGKALSATLVCF